MADEDNETASNDGAEPSLADVQKQVKSNRLILLIVGVLCSVLVCVMGTGLWVMFSRIGVLTEAAEAPEEDPMEEQFIELEQQLLILSNFRKKELKKISNFTKQLKSVQHECSIEKAIPYAQFLIERESDYQKLIVAMESGIGSLANMTKGSRKWMTPYKKSLLELKKNSTTRKKTLMNLIDSNESKK